VFFENRIALAAITIGKKKTRKLTIGLEESLYSNSRSEKLRTPKIKRTMPITIEKLADSFEITFDLIPDFLKPLAE
jgi:hypothetical protein